MILSRKEFHLRWTFRNFKTVEEKLVLFPIKPLLKEIRKDAKFRNHSYLFNGSDLSKVKCDDEIGINIHCRKKAKTESERMVVIDEQIRKGTYKPVGLFQEIDYPNIIFVDDGFHRIYSAWKQGKKRIWCNVKQGHFILEKVMPFKDLPALLGMLSGMFPKEMHDIKKLRKFLKNADKKKMRITSIGYGKP